MRNLIRILSVIAAILECVLILCATQEKYSVCRPVGADGCCPACGEPQPYLTAYRAGGAYCSRCGTRLIWRKENKHEH